MEGLSPLTSPRWSTSVYDPPLSLQYFEIALKLGTAITSCSKPHLSSRAHTSMSLYERAGTKHNNAAFDCAERAGEVCAGECRLAKRDVTRECSCDASSNHHNVAMVYEREGQDCIRALTVLKACSRNIVQSRLIQSNSAPRCRQCMQFNYPSN